MQRAFSLVELSIVLVILGLLVGGILAGQSLIRAAELRAVSTEYQRYSSAINAFRDKYLGIPGDLNNGTQFWGTTTASGTVNGNGDRIIDNAAALSATGEVYQFWRQLAFAGLIEGNYTGLAGPVSAIDSVLASNVPRSRIVNAGWSLEYLPNFVGDAYSYAIDYGNEMNFGAQVSGSITIGSVLRPEEAWNVDTKIDDGLPAKGKVIARNWDNCTTSTSKTDLTGAYDFTATTFTCALTFSKLF